MDAPKQRNRVPGKNRYPLEFSRKIETAGEENREKKITLTAAYTQPATA